MRLAADEGDLRAVRTRSAIRRSCLCERAAEGVCRRRRRRRDRGRSCPAERCRTPARRRSAGRPATRRETNPSRSRASPPQPARARRDCPEAVPTLRVGSREDDAALPRRRRHLRTDCGGSEKQQEDHDRRQTHVRRIGPPSPGSSLVALTAASWNLRTTKALRSPMRDVSTRSTLRVWGRRRKTVRASGAHRLRRRRDARRPRGRGR